MTEKERFDQFQIPEEDRPSLSDFIVTRPPTPEFLVRMKQNPNYLRCALAAWNEAQKEVEAELGLTSTEKTP